MLYATKEQLKRNEYAKNRMLQTPHMLPSPPIAQGMVECKYCKQLMELGSLRLHFKQLKRSSETFRAVIPLPSTLPS